MITRYANNDLNILERLKVEGISGRLLADLKLMIGMINQRLVQRLCLHYKVPYPRVPDWLKEDDRILLNGIPQPAQVFMRHLEDYVHCYRGIVERISWWRQ